MRILLVHNFYGSESPSGENLVFETEKQLLDTNGHEVEIFVRFSDDIRIAGTRGLLQGAVSVPWNPISAYKMKRKVREFRPDVVHAHNTFPLISPSIFHAVGRQSAKILTLHNYRLLCPAGVPMRNGVVCTDCIQQHSVIPSLRYGCYRSSKIATLPLATSVALHRYLGTWRDKVDSFIALSEFQRQLMFKGGLPVNRISVKPNFYPGSPSVLPYEDRSNYIVFVGRLGVEKGVHTLIEAWSRWGSLAPKLLVVGDGPLRKKLELQAENLPVEFLGQVTSKHAQSLIADARLLVLPSECFEGFPMVIREAFAFGTPVAVSNLGPLPTIVEHGVNGVVFQAGSPEAIFSCLRELFTHQNRLIEMSNAARREFETLYNEKANYNLLMKIYEDAIEVNERKAS